mmetsp:Transcript_21713/g.16018  ORF Transcript_21713/g.16018 Transcript_21713/m.16018 type:complete len:110 (-) Transcript_21713:337-666(-)
MTRATKAWAVIIILVAISFTFIYYVQYFSLVLTSKYPDLNCVSVAESYGDQLEYYAFKEYNNFMNKDQEYFLQGSLQCFCYDQNKTGLGLIDNTVYTNPENPDEQEQIC